MNGRCVNHDGNPAARRRKVCRDCVQRFRDAMTLIASDTTALLLIANRQASTTAPDRSGIRTQSAHAVLPIQEHAWELYRETEELIRLAALQCRLPAAVRRTASVPALIYGILKDDRPLLDASDARSWWRDVTDMAGKIGRAVDPPMAQVAYGACPFCPNGIVWGEPRAHMGACRSCGAEVNRTYVPDRLLDRLAKSEKKGTPKQLSDQCAKAGFRLPASTIRSWTRQGRLTPDRHGRIPLSSIVPLIRERAQ